MALTKREKEMLALAVKKPSILKLADDEILKSKNFFLEAAAIKPDVLKYADKSLKESRWLAERLISNNGMTYRYFGREIKDEIGFALAAIENTPDVAPYILKGVQEGIASRYTRKGAKKASKNIALFFAQTIDMHIHVYIGDYIDDKEVMLVAVKHSGSNIRSASSRLQTDLDILKAAYKQNPHVFKNDTHLEKSKALFIGDRDFIIEVLKETERPCIEPAYADDEEIVLLAMNKSRYMYRYASNRLRDREDITKMAIECDSYLFEDASKRLRNDKDFVISLAAINASVLQYVPTSWRGNKEFVLDFLSNVSAENQFTLLHLLPRKFADDEEIVAACVAAQPANFKLASKRLQNSTDFALNLMMTYDIDLTEYLSKEILESEEVVDYFKKKDFKKRFGL